MITTGEGPLTLTLLTCKEGIILTPWGCWKLKEILVKYLGCGSCSGNGTLKLQTPPVTLTLCSKSELAALAPP